MNDARMLVYTNARWLVEQLRRDTDEGAATTALDPVRVWSVADFILGMLDILQEGECADPLAPCPALERWRTQILESRGRQPLEVAAAWELTALACEHAGLSEAAASARNQARDALNARRVA